MNAINRSDLFVRWTPIVTAAAIFLLAAGCEGGASISSPFPAQQTVQQTAQQSAQQTTSAQPAISSQQSDPAQTTQTDPQQNSPQSDAPATQEAVTVSPDPQPQITPPQSTIAVTDPTPADITDLVLVTGQSNALGADTNFNPALDSPDTRTFAYTQSGWKVADLSQIWDQGWFPRGDPATDPSNNFSLHFGKRVTAIDSNRVVGFILVTAPGRPISHWQPNGEFFNSIRDKVSRAISELPSKSQVDAILWHQGESDGADDPAYGSALYALVDAFRSESWYGTNRPFICGETAALPVNTQLNRLNSDGDASTACVPAAGLETRIDDAHFSANALRTLGRRYAEQYLKMTR